MRTTLLLMHIIAGSLGLLSVFAALCVAKGAPLHRKVGMFFVTVILTMATSGMVLAVIAGEWAIINLAASIVTAYLAVTALLTVRPPSAGSRRLERAAMLVGLAVGLTMLTFGLEAIGLGGKREGIPAFPFFMFGLLGLFGGLGHLRRMRSGPPADAVRIARHLWRMCFALFIATMSFFIGQADVFPNAMRIMPLLALPPLSVLATMLYWSWRVRVRRPNRGPIGGDAPATAPAPPMSPRIDRTPA